ncbi:uncharacterized protein [Typha latifolia]|uniref:uncharacterized protein n=1 Tax=Typha latifolia TaxID=4733 RepID=UPI003C2C014E
MASLTIQLSPTLPRRFASPSRRYHSRGTIMCKANEGDTATSSGGSAVEVAAAVAGLVSCPVIGVSLYTLKTTGCGLPPGPGGSLGAVEGVSYLVVAGLVVWSIATKARTGSGLPAGPYGLLGAAEGLAYLTALAVAVVFGLQILERGSLPGPLPTDQCFG